MSWDIRKRIRSTIFNDSLQGDNYDSYPLLPVNPSIKKEREVVPRELESNIFLEIKRRTDEGFIKTQSGETC
jgi:hypothetical protein